MQQPGEKNASGLASLERARTVVWTLWKILTDLLIGFGHLLLLGLLFGSSRTATGVTSCDHV
jgi:hypothetical protein